MTTSPAAAIPPTFVDEDVAYLRELAGKMERGFYSISPKWMRDLATRIEGTLAAARREREWQPIETAPKDGRNVLVRYRSTATCVAHDFIVEAWWCVSEWQTADGCYSLNGEALHWMSLPAPPTTTEDRP